MSRAGMLARAGALVAAVAMVVAAVYARHRIDEKAVTSRLVCSTELAEACKDLHLSGAQVTVEPAGTTFDRLVALDPDAEVGIDGWLVPEPWPQMVNAERARRALPPLFTDTSTRVGSTRLGVTVETQRFAGVRTTCKDPAPWSCIAALPSRAWRDLGANVNGLVKADLPDPSSEAAGLAVLAVMSQSVLGDRAFSRDDDAVRGLVRGLKAAQTRPGRDALDTVFTFPADIDTAMTTEADVENVRASAANPNAATTIYPAPVATMNAVLGTTGDGEAGRKLVTAWKGASGQRALAGAGWKAADTAAAADPGVLAALRQLWLDQR